MGEEWFEQFLMWAVVIWNIVGFCWLILQIFKAIRNLIQREEPTNKIGF